MADPARLTGEQVRSAAVYGLALEVAQLKERLAEALQQLGQANRKQAEILERVYAAEARLAEAEEDFRATEGELEQLRRELTETEDRLAAAENVVEAARAVSETSGSPHDALDAMYEALNVYDAHKGKP